MKLRVLFFLVLIAAGLLLFSFSNAAKNLEHNSIKQSVLQPVSASKKQASWPARPIARPRIVKNPCPKHNSSKDSCPFPIVVTISPSTATVVTSHTQAFTAFVTGSPLSTAAVTWEVNGLTGGNSTTGTISTSGVYTAPSSVPSGGTVTATARSVANTTKTSSATITIVAAGSNPVLSLTVTGTGTVTSSPAGINCPTDCAQAYSPGQVVTLTETPGGGETFSGWSGVCSGTSPTCTLTVSSDTDVVATFSGSGGGGSGGGGSSCSGTCNHYYVSPTGSGTTCSTGARCALSYALANFTLGADGAVIHGAKGSYANPGNWPRGGTSTARLVVQCDEGAASAYVAKGKCSLAQADGAGRGFFIETPGVNYVDIVGWDIGNNSNMGNGIFIAGGGNCGSTGNFTCGNGVRILNNYLHDMGQNITGGTGILGCPSNGGAIGIGTHGGTLPAPGAQVIGNVVVRYGRPNLPTCNQGAGIYIDSGNVIAENNIVAQIAGEDIQVFSSPCSVVVSNNTLINGSGGAYNLVFANGATGCSFLGRNTINNNFFIGASRAHIGMNGQQSCDATHLNLWGHNYTDGGVPDFDTTLGFCNTVSPSPMVHTSGTSLFVNYLLDGSGDYHLKTGALAIDAGTTPCVAGGTSPCVPSIDLDGVARPQGSAYDVGAYEHTSVSNSLTVAISGTGSVNSSPAGIGCPSSCTALFTSGTTVTLTATAPTGVTFSGWSGPCSGTGLCVLNLTSNTTVGATFTGSSTGTTIINDSFNTGLLDTSTWVYDSGSAPGNIAGVNSGSFSTPYCDLSTSMLRLKLTQTGSSPVISTGCEVRSVNRYGYGTYSFTMRAASTAATSAGVGTLQSGQISSPFLYVQAPTPLTEIDAPEIEGQAVFGDPAGQTLEYTSWTNGVQDAFSHVTAGFAPDQGFHVYKMVWSAGSIQYYTDGTLRATQTTNVPTQPAYIIMNLWGTNSTGFGGLATTGVTRYMYISNFTLTTNTVVAAAHPTINDTYFGMSEANIAANGDPLVPVGRPDLPEGQRPIFRINNDQFPTNVKWLDLETCDGGTNQASGCYHFTALDGLVSAIQAAGFDIDYTAGYAPDWVHTTMCPSDVACPCTNDPRTCWPPDDLSTNATSGVVGNMIGPNQHWKDFVSVMRTRYDGAHGHGRIRVWGSWNEPNSCSAGVGQFWFTTGGTCGSTTARLALAHMHKDALNAFNTLSGNRTHMPDPQGPSADAYLDGLFTQLSTLGSLSSLVDIVAFHGYVNAGNVLNMENTLVGTLTGITSSMSSHGIPTKDLWDTENSWGRDSNYNNRDLEGSWPTRHFAIDHSYGVKQHSWWAYGTTSGFLSSDFGSVYIKPSGPITQAGNAVLQYRTQVLGGYYPSHCSVAGTLWTCPFNRSDNTAGEWIWDSSKTGCTGGTVSAAGSCPTALQTVPTQFTNYYDITGTKFAITSHQVQVGIKPLFLTTH